MGKNIVISHVSTIQKVPLATILQIVGECKFMTSSAVSHPPYPSVECGGFLIVFCLSFLDPALSANKKDLRLNQFCTSIGQQFVCSKLKNILLCLQSKVECLFLFHISIWWVHRCLKTHFYKILVKRNYCFWFVCYLKHRRIWDWTVIKYAWQ